MSAVADQWSSLWPALMFLIVGVPLAALLDRLGFFTAAAQLWAGRAGDKSVLALWVFAALTTVVLNLDTTVVLLTPLYLRIATEVDCDPVALGLIPLFLASFASSVLPVSNLTNLIVSDQLDVGVTDFLAHVALPSLAASVVGWFAYRRRFQGRVSAIPAADAPDSHALGWGAVIVVGLLIGFTAGPAVGIAPWMTAAAADLVLVCLTRSVPWRDVPVLTAAGVAIVAAFVALVVPADAFTQLIGHDRASALVAIASTAGVMANVVNNLPALLVALDGLHHMSWGMWAWLLGVNTAAVIVPIGALANLLWLRILRSEGVHLRYVDTRRSPCPSRFRRSRPRRSRSDSNDSGSADPVGSATT